MPAPKRVHVRGREKTRTNPKDYFGSHSKMICKVAENLEYQGYRVIILKKPIPVSAYQRTEYDEIIWYDSHHKMRISRFSLKHLGRTSMQVQEEIMDSDPLYSPVE